LLCVPLPSFEGGAAAAATDAPTSEAAIKAAEKEAKKTK
jgi:hypothetical protein